MRVAVLGALTATLLCCGCSRSAGDIADAMRLVRANLKDPRSAQFSNVAIYDSPEFSNPGKRVRSACGIVNAKNSYGGYVGARRFIVMLGIDNVLFEPDEFDAKFEEGWQVRCTKPA